jgi:hypothetical protein
MNVCAYYFCGKKILITTAFHITKSASAGGIADFFLVDLVTFRAKSVRYRKKMYSQSMISRKPRFGKSHRLLGFLIRSIEYEHFEN